MNDALQNKSVPSYGRLLNLNGHIGEFTTRWTG